MTIGLMKLAYMAEFAIAFNLTFGEFRHERTAQFLNAQFESLDHNCMGAAMELISDVQPDALVKQRDARFNMTTSWLGRRIADLDVFRQVGRQPSSDKYKPLTEFARRVKLFATNPFALDDDAKPSRIRAVGRILWGIPGGLLAAFAYPNTPNWEFPPCRSSVLIWSLLLCCLLVFTGAADTNGSVLVDVVFWSFHIPFHPFVGVTAGFFAAMLVPRPLSLLAAIFIGRQVPSPRGRYYPLVTVLVVTIILITITLVDGEASSGGTWLSSSVVWYFLFGYLLGALTLPLILLIGYMLLERIVERWAGWLAHEAARRGKEEIQKLKTLVEEVPIPHEK